MKIDPASHEEDLKKAERIAYLIAGHLRGTLTAAEADELDAWIVESDENLELFENLTDEDNIEIAMQQYLQTEKQKDAAFAQLQTPAQGSTKRRNKLKLWPYLVAASLLVAAISFYLLSYNRQHTSNEKPIAQNEKKGDVKAGSDKAVLILSDGRTIILDSTGSGVIANEGSINIRQKGGEIVYSGTGAQISYNTVATPRGGQYQITLGDNSKVWLNAESSLKFSANIGAATREVELKGEAYFEVAKNPSSPFRVKIPTRQGEESIVEVLGTRFNIDNYGDENIIKAVLLEGSIRVQKGNESKVLKPGQQATIGNNISIRDVDIAESVAWKEGKFLFRDATVRSIGEQIKRWYNIDVIVEGEVNQHFNMEISRKVPLSRLLAALEKTGQVHFSLTEKKLIIRP